MTEADIEAQIREMFEENYELLQAEGGHALTQDGKNAALRQVLLYWQKMRDVAENVTDTEVKLNLPDQMTPKGRKYGIEGVVDIIREDDRTVMYDIKTHDYDYVNKNKELYEKQLNVYAYIWQSLRGQELDQTAIIATAFPTAVQEALDRDDERRLAAALEEWNLLIDIPFDQLHVGQTIADFGAVVDAIEENKFAPASVEKLKTRFAARGRELLFATQVCRNCDARFSCSSYRNYVVSSGGRSDSTFARYFQEFGSDSEQEEWLTANLDAAPSPEAFEV
ncbi:PD-(D/E)XK nuclease family protein [Cyanobacteria bacterium FACHB-471]|nr:PD-(D/E)XK nuclease family protein [Cyanobacteria bacterium FACHB-471]